MAPKQSVLATTKTTAIDLTVKGRACLIALARMDGGTLRSTVESLARAAVDAREIKITNDDYAKAQKGLK